MSEGLDVNKKNSGLHKCIICHYWYFLTVNLRFQSKICEGCHYLMQKAAKVLMMLQLFLFKDMIIKFIFGI